VGLSYLLYFSIKNSGFFSKQALLIVIGGSVPTIVNLFVSIGILPTTAYATPISFVFAIVCFAFSILKFEFLNISPIALQLIVDRISDSFVVVNNEYFIIDYNKTFLSTFNNIFKIKRNINFLNLFDETGLADDIKDEFEKNLDKTKIKKESNMFEKHFKFEGFDKYFTVEVTPVISQGNYLGTIVLMKDITQAKLDLEKIKENQAILLEQERLASLGQLIGGIAHNLKTPIMSISGGIEALKDLVFEYRDSIDDRSVTEQDHKEIAKDMMTWLEKMKPYCAYMSDVISAVKGQAVRMNASSTDKFTVDELIKRVDLLMKHELKMNHCLLNIESQIDMKTEIKGEVNNLVQVFDNIIINAVHAYEGKDGIIDLKIIRSGDNIEFIIRDFGKGIPKEINDRLFKEMVTTKGKKGTGLGLYMSYSTIKGRFSGNMSFTTKEGNGTTFYISIPCISQYKKEDS
jgi:Signal transduction histidine kinase